MMRGESWLIVACGADDDDDDAEAEGAAGAEEVLTRGWGVELARTRGCMG